MQLATSNAPSRVMRTGKGEFIVSAEKTLRIETTPGGAEILNVEVPAGKQWEAYITVSVVETDA